MARTPSTMLPLGTHAPGFTLPDVVNGHPVSFSEMNGAPGLLVMFICNHCPYVIHVRPELLRYAREATAKGLKIVAINSNSAVSHPQDGPVHMKKLATDEQWPFPFLFDETQKVAHAYRAACTPDFFLFDREGRLVYRGQFDGSRPGSDVPVTGEDLRRATDAVLAGQKPSEDQRPSLGCNIKWAPGNEPKPVTFG